MNNKVIFSSKKEDWGTPQDFFDKLNTEFHFTLDPCADEYNHKCDNYFTIKDNGLSQYWGGGKARIFCNPPYGKEIGKWVKKCYEESLLGATVVLLIPARTDTAYFHDWILNKARIYFIKGRLKFGGANNNAPFPSIVCVYKKDT